MFQKTLWGCGSKLDRCGRQSDLLAGLDSPFDGEVPTRFEAKNTSSSKSHTFSYVSGSFDLNDGSDNRLVGCDSFRNNVSPLEKQRAFLADKGLEISREAWSWGLLRPVLAWGAVSRVNQ